MPQHPNAVAEYRDKLRANMGHGRMCVGIEHLERLNQRRGTQQPRTVKLTSSVISIGPGILESEESRNSSWSQRRPFVEVGAMPTHSNNLEETMHFVIFGMLKHIEQGELTYEVPG